MDRSHEDLTALLATNLDRHFEQLMLAYQHRLYAFAFRLTGNARDAEDILQEAFLHAYHALKNYPEPRIRTLQLSQWLYKIILNVFRNIARKPELQSVSLDLSEDNPLLEIEDQALGPDEEAYWHEWKDALEMHVATLPQQYRIAVNLHYFEDLSYQEIAMLLNQPAGTVKANVHRGLRMLRRTLETQSRRTK